MKTAFIKLTQENEDSIFINTEYLYAFFPNKTRAGSTIWVMGPVKYISNCQEIRVIEEPTKIMQLLEELNNARQ